MAKYLDAPETIMAFADYSKVYALATGHWENTTNLGHIGAAVGARGRLLMLRRDTALRLGRR